MLFSGLERADVPALIEALQAVSSELDLDKLIETVLVIALEREATQRGVLFLVRGSNLQIEADAGVGRAGATVKAHFGNIFRKPNVLRRQKPLS